MKKSVLIIGIGRLGSHLARRMRDLGCDVMVLDDNREAIEKYVADFSDARIADYTNREVLEEIDAKDFDIVFITVGTNFTASMITAAMLKDMGARYVAARARDEIECELLDKIGVDEVIYADGQVAETLAVRHSGNRIFNYISLGGEGGKDGAYGVFELAISPDWVGKTIGELDVRKKYNINIVALRRGKDVDPSPTPEFRFEDGDHIFVIGKTNDYKKISKRF